MDVLKRRLNETERTMDKMMEMMNNMGVAFNRVTEQLNSKSILSETFHIDAIGVLHGSIQGLHMS